MGQYTTLPINNRTFTDYSKLVFLTDFGVIGNGIADDTAALNAAFASLLGTSGTIVWNVGFCKVTSTIIVGQLASSGVTSYINIWCPNGQINSGIKWAGATNGTALAFARNKYFRVVGLGVYNTVARGTTVGVLLGGDGAGFGNAVNNGFFQSCLVDGFSTCVQAGGNFGAASELTFHSVQFQNTDVGFTTTDFNSLDFTFHMVALASCGIGIDTGAASGFAVFGGSASQSSIADFKIQLNSTQTYIGGGFRSETSAACVLGIGGGDVVIDKILVTNAQGASFNSITGVFRSLIVRDSAIDGFINPTQAQVVEITGCALARWDTTRGLPAIFTSIATDIRVRGYFRDNFDIGTFPPRRIFDHQGLFSSRSGAAFYDPVMTVMLPDRTSATDFGFDYLALSHARHLGEGPIPGATAGTVPVTGKNLRVSDTFAGAATIAFTFTRSLTVTSNGGPVVTATVGTFRATDAGKPMKITGGADTGGDWYGYITDYLTSSTANVFPSAYSSPGGRFPSQSSGHICAVGQDEPDTNYFVAGLVGNSSETFWVDTLATTGFTFHTSNSTSGATVVALIVR